MLSIFLIVLTGLLLFLSSFISNNTKLFDRRRSVERMITKHGWYVIVINMLIVGLSICQYNISEQKQILAKKEARKESDERDSVLRSDYFLSVQRITNNYDRKAREIRISSDSNANILKTKYDTSTTNIVKALAEYGLTYNIRSDSVENLIRHSRSPEPDFGLCDSAIKVLDTVSQICRLSMNFCSDKATSQNIHSICYLMWHLKDGAYLYYGQYDFLGDNAEIPADKGVAVPFSVDKELLSRTAQLFVILKCSYTNKDGSKQFSNRKFIYSYDFIHHRNSLSSTYFDEKIKSVLKANNVNL